MGLCEEAQLRVVTFGFDARPVTAASGLRVLPDFASEHVDLAADTGRCNCSICGKTRSWGVIVQPADFRLTSGEDALSVYQFGSRSMRYEFCPHCGVRPFGHGHLEQLGGDFVFINIATLDDAADNELAAAPVNFANGRDDDWMNTPAVTTQL